MRRMGKELANLCVHLGEICEDGRGKKNVDRRIIYVI
jgi:hypothetical protein